MAYSILKDYVAFNSPQASYPMMKLNRFFIYLSPLTKIWSKLRLYKKMLQQI